MISGTWKGCPGISPGRMARSWCHTTFDTPWRVTPSSDLCGTGWLRYAIKETTPRMAEREIANLHEIERRGIPALSPVGSVVVQGPLILLEEHGPNGVPEYVSGDRGYTVTRLAPSVIPTCIAQ